MEIIALKVLFIAAALLFLGTMVAVAFRLWGRSGVTRITFKNKIEAKSPDEAMAALSLEDRYRELIELGMIQLEPEEQVIAGCGRRGDTEEVLLVTGHRAFILTRRSSSTFFAKQIFHIDHLRPIPSSAGLVGNKLILSDGVKTSAIDSPGNRGYLEDAKEVVRELNGRIRKARSEPVSSPK